MGEEVLFLRVVLFNPKISDSFRAPYIPLGILSIATYLNANGHAAIICDRFFENSSVENVIREHSADIIGISIISHTYIHDAIEISKIAKRIGKPVVWGGSLSSALYKELLNSDYADYVSFNEGEETWLEMAESFDKCKSFDDIRGLGYIKDGHIICTDERDFLDLSSLPDLDWSLIKPENYFQRSYGYNKQLNTYMSKGCTGRCTYCYNPGFHRSVRRCRPLDQVMREMRYLVDEHGADGFDFTDDLMFSNINDVYDFCNKLEEYKLDICWSGYLSLGVVNKIEDYRFMYKAGCRSLIFGVESGSAKVLKGVNKANRLKYVKSNVENCVSSGIIPITMFMLGFPDENAEDIKETIALAKELKGASVAYGFVTPIPGTKLYEDLVLSGKMNPPKDIEGFAKIKEAENLFGNFTNVPTKELVVIKRFIRLRGIVTPTEHSTDEQLVKVFLSTAKSWFGGGILKFFLSSFRAVFKVLVTFTIFLHPIIRKKYGLYFTK